MANDIASVDSGGTYYVWGGWDASGFYSFMIEIDAATGTQRQIPVDTVRFLRQGFVTNPAWTWTPGMLLYLGANSVITQTRPASGPITVLGVAYSATTICFCPRPPK